MKLFVFDLSFIGWYILTAVVPLGMYPARHGRSDCDEHRHGGLRCSRQLWWRRYA